MPVAKTTDVTISIRTIPAQVVLERDGEVLDRALVDLDLDSHCRVWDRLMGEANDLVKTAKRLGVSVRLSGGRGGPKREGEK